MIFKKPLKSSCQLFFSLLIMLSVTLFSSNLQAQSSVRVIDFQISEMAHSVDSIQMDSIALTAQFKIKSADIADSLFLYLGTAQNMGDVLTIQGIFISQGGGNFISFSEQLEEIQNYHGKLSFRLSIQQYNAFTDATLSIKDKTGVYAPKLYFKK